MKSSVDRRQLAGIILFGLGAIALIAGFVVLFMLNYGKVYPPQVKFLDDGTHIYCSVQANDNYVGYRFCFENDGNTTQFDSADSVMDILPEIKEGNLTAGTRYTVYAIYVGEMEGGNSEKGYGVVWTAYQKLDTPVVTSVTGDSVTWSAVENADSYSVCCYGDNNSFERIDDIASTSIAKSSLPAGLRTVSVIAHSNNPDAYPDSDESARSDQFKNTKTLAKFESVVFDPTSHMITITGSEFVNFVVISVDGTTATRNVTSANYRQDSVTGKYIYTFSLGSMGSESSEIKAKPSMGNTDYWTEPDFTTWQKTV